MIPPGSRDQNILSGADFATQFTLRVSAALRAEVGPPGTVFLPRPPLAPPSPSPKTHKVLRDTRLGASAPGSAFRVVEEETWRRRRLDLFVRLRNDLPQAHPKETAKQARLGSDMPRLVSMDLLCAIDHRLSHRQGGVASQGFLPEPTARDEDLKPTEEVGPVLVLTMDQCQIGGWTVGRFGVARRRARAGVGCRRSQRLLEGRSVCGRAAGHWQWAGGQSR